ncbi:ComEC family competence protein [Actinomadura rubteroloni]|uniref:ComEC family competence protein n=1 Tax=Actinomadura rubteroloni TaxID=1926885 RepID=A0A2P4UFJ4_9ACTN|nr:MBL fold metallo-hydrolase [Actinomadura rubteroloni]POM23805.1 ComEC family competence protein [Actinomadura rubteroloni]
MGFEIDFLPVGDESSGGDAIAIRCGNLYGPRSQQTVIVVDGGYTDDGEALVEHIAKYYNTTTVDIVVSTHPDQDHITGLKVVLEEMHVKQLLMHLPWKHSSAMARAKTVSFKVSTLSDKLKASLQGAASLEEVAKQRGVPVIEPFAGVGTSDGVFRVLGPSEEYYRELLAEIVEPTEAKSSLPSIKEALRKLAASLVPETIFTETLREDGETSPRNNTSAVCLLTIDERKLLLTGDAGIPALGHVLDRLEGEGFAPGDLNFVQVPHHGSRRNVSPSLLDRLLGTKGQTTRVGSAFVSAPAKNPEHKHPAKKTTNAFHRRGYPVHVTQGTTKRHHHDAPTRPGWSASIPEPFHENVEDNGDS